MSWFDVIRMRHIIFLVVLTGLHFLAPLRAQSHGYAFFGTTLDDGNFSSGVYRYGAGGNWSVFPRVTLGGEVGGVQHRGIILSGNTGFHFRRHVEHGFDPFVTVGVSGMYVSGASALYANLGGGVNYWFLRRLGARVEFRTYRGGTDLNDFSEFRFGVSFRR